MNFGNILRKLRQDNNLTQDELANKLGTSRSNIANYENNKNMPSVDMLEKLSKEFHCSTDYLMGKSNQKNVEILDFENAKKYFEEKLNITLKNKYFNAFQKLGLTNFEIENLIKSLDFNDELNHEKQLTLLNSTLSILEINYSEDTLSKIKSLMDKYIQETINLLDKELTFINKKSQQQRQELIAEHIDELHHSISGKASASLDENVDALLTFLKKNDIENFCMCPVYGCISAGQPNWAEECLEGYLPIDPALMNIIDPEDHFFLRVNGESMNKVIRNGAYALIHKQDAVDNGEIAVVLVNGFEATLKKFSKQGDLIILEPISDDPSFNTQVYSNDTEIKILGKYVGKFEMNK